MSGQSRSLSGSLTCERRGLTRTVLPATGSDGLDDDLSVHGETDAFRNAGRQRTHRGTTMVTTLSPCWFCSGLVRQFGISRLVVGEARTFSGGHDRLAEGIGEEGDPADRATGS
jgi:tRNA(Arg) A34 adenosine deaminase TadA